MNTAINETMLEKEGLHISLPVKPGQKIKIPTNKNQINQISKICITEEGFYIKVLFDEDRYYDYEFGKVWFLV